MASNDLTLFLLRFVAHALMACALWQSTAQATPSFWTPPGFYHYATLESADGGFLLGGSIRTDAPFGYSFAVVRLNRDGTPDLSFNGTGFVAVPIWGYYEAIGALAVQPD